MDLSGPTFNSSLQVKTHIWPQKQQFGYFGFQEKFNTFPPKSTEAESSFRKFFFSIMKFMLKKNKGYINSSAC